MKAIVIITNAVGVLLLVQAGGHWADAQCLFKRFCPKRKCGPNEQLVTLPGRCCPQCKFSCFYDGQWYPYGQSFSTPNHCQKDCTCIDSRFQCTTHICKPLPCPRGMETIHRHGECCPVCSSGCSLHGQWYPEGESIPSPNPCQQCFCYNGGLLCKTQDCKYLLCPRGVEPIIPPGKCCPVCSTRCFLHGKWYPHGASIPIWKQCQDKCMCYNGRVRCTTEICEPFKCPYDIKIITPPGKCCPVCSQGCTYQSKWYPQGASVPGPSACHENCFCRDGTAHCTFKTCQSLGCPEEATAVTHSDPCCRNCRTE